MLAVFILLVSLITIYIIKIQNIDRPSKKNSLFVFFILVHFFIFVYARIV